MAEMSHPAQCAAPHAAEVEEPGTGLADEMEVK
jgi:hypothetical protein